MVRALIVFLAVSLVSVSLFFALPSTSFGLPDVDADSADVFDDEEVFSDEPETEELPISIPSDSGADSVDIDEGSEVVADGSELELLDSVRSVVAQPYDGTLSSTYVDIGRDCLWGLRWFDDYVFYRASNNTYNFCYGDLSYSNGVFSSPSCTILTITAPSSYTGSMTVSSSVDSLSLSTSGRLVYSNLGGFPALDSRKYIYDEVMYIAVVALGVHVLASASSFILRNSAGGGRAD